MWFQVTICYVGIFSLGLNNDAYQISSRYHNTWPHWHWENRTVHFDIDPFIRSNRLMYTTILDAVEYMNSITCVRWVQRFPWDDGVKDYVNFRMVQDRPIFYICRSELGFTRLQQFIDLSNWCIRNYHRERHGNRVRTRTPVLHEMMHTMSFRHEHQRPDRDCYFWTSEQVRNNPIWKKEPKVQRYTTDDFPYDFESIMHYYAHYNVAHPHDPTIRTTGRTDGRLSALDVWRVEVLYCGRPGYCEVRGQHECDRIQQTNSNNPNCTKYDANALG